jgi:hypothetical protein
VGSATPPSWRVSAHAPPAALMARIGVCFVWEKPARHALGHGHNRVCGATEEAAQSIANDHVEAIARAGRAGADPGSRARDRTTAASCSPTPRSPKWWAASRTRVLSLKFHQIIHRAPASESLLSVVHALANMVVELAHKDGSASRGRTGCAPRADARGYTPTRSKSSRVHLDVTVSSRRSRTGRAQ